MLVYQRVLWPSIFLADPGRVLRKNWAKKGRNDRLDLAMAHSDHSDRTRSHLVRWLNFPLSSWMWLIHLSPQSLFQLTFLSKPQATSPISINQYQHIITTRSVKVWLRQGSRGEAAPGGIHPLQPGRSACDRPLRAAGQEQFQLELSEEDYTGAKGAGSTWVCLKMVYTPNYSHLVGIMIINHWV